MPTSYNENENQAKAEKINMFWIFAFGVLVLVWMSSTLRPGKMSASKEVTEIAQPYVIPSPPPIK